MMTVHADHYLPVYKRQHDAPLHVVLVIADSTEAAVKIGRRIAQKSIPEIYLFECDCRAAWRALPAPLAQRHHPYRVSLSTGFLEHSTKRLDHCETVQG